MSTTRCVFTSGINYGYLKEDETTLVVLPPDSSPLVDDAVKYLYPNDTNIPYECLEIKFRFVVGECPLCQHAGCYAARTDGTIGDKIITAIDCKNKMIFAFVIGL